MIKLLMKKLGQFCLKKKKHFNNIKKGKIMKKLKERSLTKEEMKAFDNVNQMESIHYVITKKEESLRKHALNLNDIEKNT